jgi:hypothetical protein
MHESSAAVFSKPLGKWVRQIYPLANSFAVLWEGRGIRFMGNPCRVYEAFKYSTTFKIKHMAIIP